MKRQTILSWGFCPWIGGCPPKTKLYGVSLKLTLHISRNDNCETFLFVGPTVHGAQPNVQPMSFRVRRSLEHRDAPW